VRALDERALHALLEDVTWCTRKGVLSEDLLSQKKSQLIWSQPGLAQDRAKRALLDFLTVPDHKEINKGTPPALLRQAALTPDALALLL